MGFKAAILLTYAYRICAGSALRINCFSTLMLQQANVGTRSHFPAECGPVRPESIPPVPAHYPSVSPLHASEAPGPLSRRYRTVAVTLGCCGVPDAMHLTTSEVTGKRPYEKTQAKSNSTRF